MGAASTFFLVVLFWGGGRKKMRQKKAILGAFFFVGGATIILMRMQIKGFWGNLGVIWVFFWGGGENGDFWSRRPQKRRIGGGENGNLGIFSTPPMNFGGKRQEIVGGM